MKKVKVKKLLAGIICATFLGTTLWGCGNSKEKVEEKKPNENKPAVEQKIIYNLGADPKTLDPQLNSATDGGIVIANAFEGLMRQGADSKPVPGVAEKFDLSEDGKVYTFHLRDNAKWSDGKSVVAGDFEYAWKRALNPEVNAEYSYQLFYIKNGEAYFNKKVSEDQVGVKALDEKTLEVTLESPVSYFLDLTFFATYAPVRKDMIESKGDKWALSPESYIGNGAFKMSEWNEKERITFVKNENYWDADKVKLEKLEYTLIDDQVTYLNSFKSGEIDLIESPPSTEIPSLLADGTAKAYPYFGTYFYVINVSDQAEKIDPAAAKVLKDAKVRTALELAIDKKMIVEKVSQGGQEPATSYVPPGIVDSKNTPFHKSYLPETGDVAKAKELLKEAGYPDGKGFPKITFTFNTNQGHQMVAQAVQDMWKNNLGIQVELKNEEWAVFQETRNNFQFSIARHGWIGDYNDPMTFLDMWVTGNGQNNAGYSNPEYDKLIASARVEVDVAKRTEMLHKAEDLLMADMPIIPIYYYSNIICANPKVKGFVKTPLGLLDFKEAYIE